ncbi:MAG: hypothetical protein AAGF84_07775 [Planctomycetota bacterium]
MDWSKMRDSHVRPAAVSTMPRMDPLNMTGRTVCFRMASAIAVALTAVVVLPMTGCDDPQDDVRVYTARIDPPPPPIQGQAAASLPAPAATPPPMLANADAMDGSSQPRELAWDLPADFGFRDTGETNQFRLTTLRAGEPENPESALEVAVSRIAGQAGSITGNVNRWRQQLGLPPLSQEEVVGVVEWVSNESLSGMFTRIESDNGEAGTMIAWFTLDNANWFFKANGTPEALDLHREGFDALVASVRLRSEVESEADADVDPDPEPQPASAPPPAPAY